MLRIKNNNLFVFIFVALHSANIYVCDGNSRYFSILPGVCHDIDYHNIPQWIRNNIDSHSKLCKQKPMLDMYDFIVVGAGAAGSVIASRLSENPRVTVLLIEAGGCENATTEIPAVWGLLLGSQYDWNYKAEPQIRGTFINTYPDGCPTINRGKSIGGSTAINGMVYLRGAPKDFDNWEKLGANGWAYSDVLPYFLRSEGNRDPKYATDRYHNTSGPLTISTNSVNISRKILIEPCEQLGFKQIDLNGAHRIGVDYSQQNIDNGVRVSVSKAFLEPVIDDRPNLHILSYSHVTRVLFRPFSRLAYGVEYRRHNRLFNVRARKEIILSAGVINSPQILLLSGIGPKKQLIKFKIPVIAELSGVGENLRDHPIVFGPTFALPKTDDSSETCRKYLKNSSGKLAHVDSQFFFVQSLLNQDNDWPDIQVCLEFVNRLSTDHTTLDIAVINGRPKSVGYLELRSADPFDQPIIQPNYLTHRDDIPVLIDGLRWAYRISQTNSYKDFGYQAFENLVPGCEKKFDYIRDTKYPNMRIPCDDYLECVVRHTTSTVFHLTGTCRMGSPHDPLAVVNPRLQVLGGIKGLRVADASVMPVVTNANTMAPSVMIGERCAQFIKDYHRI